MKLWPFKVCPSPWSHQGSIATQSTPPSGGMLLGGLLSPDDAVRGDEVRKWGHFRLLPSEQSIRAAIARSQLPAKQDQFSGNFLFLFLCCVAFALASPNLSRPNWCLAVQTSLSVSVMIPLALNFKSTRKLCNTFLT